jgi:hypothetical protein
MDWGGKNDWSTQQSLNKFSTETKKNIPADSPEKGRNGGDFP